MHFSREYRTKDGLYKALMRILKKFRPAQEVEDNKERIKRAVYKVEYTKEKRLELEISPTITILIFEKRWAIEGVEF